MSLRAPRATTPQARWLQLLHQFGLSLPDTTRKSPWLGHEDVAVHDKTFTYLSIEDDGRLRVSVKLPASGPQVLQLPHAAPTPYGLGKSGWVSLYFTREVPPDLAQVQRWMLESYRAQAPRRVLKALLAEQPWVAEGGLPDRPKR